MNDQNTPWTHIRGMQPQSFCDWPGHVSTVLFTGGCNLHCPTCHNAGLAWHPEAHPPVGREAVLSHLKKHQTWLDGVVITGGEPTLVPGLDLVCRECLDYGLPCKLDTNGLRPEIVAELLERELVALVAVDVKGPWAKYPELTGGACTADQAQANLEKIFALNARFPGRFAFRCTKVPPLSAADLAATQKLLPPEMELAFQEYIPPRPH
ncbi:MAG: anaerobic ribonucleoside-triphosphate reductase activating protein [Thermodesulfobacteriota bacterium]